MEMVGIKLLPVTSSPQVQEYEGKQKTHHHVADSSFHGDPLVSVESDKYHCYQVKTV